MDTAAKSAITDDIRKMAANIVDREVEELDAMKEKLEAYVQDVTSSLTGQSLEMANREFEKCRVCAREWINVYCDPTYHEGIKADILKEEAVEFFFTMDEKILAVQKNFFLLGMIEELQKPSGSFSDPKREAKIANARIRILAREQGLKANCKTGQNPETGEASKDRFWYFGDERNFLQSSEAGLTDDEALNYLLD